MKALVIATAVLFSVSGAKAAELADISAADVKASKIEVPAPALPAAKCGHVAGEITKMHLLAQANKSQVFSYAETEAQYNEFKAMWQPILEKFGMKVISAEYKGKYGVLKYESPDSTVLRTFLADGMNYDALSADAMKKEQHMLLEALEKQGMTPVAAFMIKTEFLRPTFNVYYLTKEDANPDHENQLRQLKNGEDIDFDLLTGAVTFVEKDASFSLVYIGKLLGSKTKLAADEAGMNVKIADYRKFLAENKKEFIASRVFKLEKPIEFSGGNFNYAANIYFFQ
ncbi:MAG: hypothetical protein NDI60_10055 [Elusimicrobiales bacterium]|nr:hypothetical protein [Elusimicrobiales bacterium]